MTALTNPGQNMYNEDIPTAAMFCRTPINGVLPPKDYFLCDGNGTESMHFMEAFNDNGGYAYNSEMIRQPFDFTGRTGVISFDVDAKTAGSHTWWPEIWITDQPIPAPHNNQSVALPRNGIDLAFNDDCGQTPGSGPSPVGSLGVIQVIKNYQQTTYLEGFNGGFNRVTCYTAMPDMRNRFNIRISQSQIQVWATDDDGTNYRLIDEADNLNLPFTRGYVSFEHADYNAEKEGQTGQQTYHWDNMGFDGPVLPMDRGYSVPDALTRGPDSGSLNLAYLLNPTGITTCCFSSVGSFTLNGVNPSGAPAAQLSMSAWYQDQNVTINYRFNNNAWQSFPEPQAPYNWNEPLPIAIPVPLNQLVSGTNTLQLTASSPTQVGNIDLTLLMTPHIFIGPTPGPEATGTATPSPAATATPTGYTGQPFTTTVTGPVSTNVNGQTVTQTVTVSVSCTYQSDASPQIVCKAQ